MIEAILYTSNTGTTAEYARLLGEAAGLPAVELKQAQGKVKPGAEIIYMGWLMASGIKGYPAAAKTYTIRAVCAVGMGETGGQMEETRKRNALPPELPLFTLQGGLDIKKLHGLYKLLINMVADSALKSLAQKPDRTPADNAMMEMLRHGGNFVSAENLAAVLEWYRAVPG